MPLRASIALVSIIGIACSSLEIELLEQVDSLSLYMTLREIALDASVGLLIVVTLAVIWWFCLLLAAKIVSLISDTGELGETLVWRLGIAAPVSYFGINALDAFFLEFAPQWYPVQFGILWSGLVCLTTCIVGISLIRVSVLQRFCRTRLVLIGWFHIAACVIAIFALAGHHVSPFKDYILPAKAITATDLPDIYLITFDALRAKETSVYGYELPTTPNLEHFAQHSFIFDYFFANSNLTTPTTTSIETGKLPWSHRIYQLGGFLRDHSLHQSLPELLRQRGYYTASFSSNYWATPIQHRSVDSYNAVQYAYPQTLSGRWMHHSELVGLNTVQTLSGSLLKRLTALRHALDCVIWRDRYPLPPEEIFARVRSWLERADTTQPSFIWMHIMPPHDPYLPPLPYRMQFLATNKLTHIYDFLGFRNTKLPHGASEAELRARYDETVLYGDHAVGEFLDWLDRTGRLDRSIVIISSDHGESFEHKWYGHTGPELYNGVIHIPLLIHLPGQRQSAHISPPAQQADILPTILDLIGERAPEWTDGRSLKPILDGKALPERSVFSMNLEPDRIFGSISKGTLAIIDDNFKYVNHLSSNKEELYSYRVDEDESDDLIESEPGVAKKMREALLQRLKEVNRSYAP